MLVQPPGRRRPPPPPLPPPAATLANRRRRLPRCCNCSVPACCRSRQDSNVHLETQQQQQQQRRSSRLAASSAAAASTDAAAAAAAEPVAAYVHLPFCKRKCWYCDFPVIAVGQGDAAQSSAVQDSMERYVDLLIREVAASRRLNQAGPLQSVFFGGGATARGLQCCAALRCVCVQTVCLAVDRSLLKPACLRCIALPPARRHAQPAAAAPARAGPAGAGPAVWHRGGRRDLHRGRPRHL